MNLDAGMLDRRIRIERFTETRDPDYNTVVKEWVTFAEAWAQVQDVLPSKSETVQNAVEVTERPSRVRMRWLRDITPDMRVVIKHAGEPDRITEIVAGPAELGRREGIELLVKTFGRSA